MQTIARILNICSVPIFYFEESLRGSPRVMVFSQHVIGHVSIGPPCCSNFELKSLKATFSEGLLMELIES